MMKKNEEKKAVINEMLIGILHSWFIYIEIKMQ